MSTYRAVTDQENDRLLAALAAKDAECERLRRAVEWCLAKGARRAENGGIAEGVPDNFSGTGYGSFEITEVPADLADIISPAAAVGQEGRE